MPPIEGGGRSDPGLPALRGGASQRVLGPRVDAGGIAELEGVYRSPVSERNWYTAYATIGILLLTGALA